MPNKRFRYLEDIATADAAFEAYGTTVEELFENAASAMFNVMAPLELIGSESVRDVTVAADSQEDLLHNWLAELVYLKDVHGELYSQFKVKIDSVDIHRLAAEVRGDTIASVRDQTHTDVKAVTYHRLAIERREGGLVATVVLDL